MCCVGEWISERCEGCSLSREGSDFSVLKMEEKVEFRNTNSYIEFDSRLASQPRLGQSHESKQIRPGERRKLGDTNLYRVYRDSYGQRLSPRQAFRLENKLIIRLGH
jgi:hypothetical protein